MRTNCEVKSLLPVLMLLAIVVMPQIADAGPNLSLSEDPQITSTNPDPVPPSNPNDTPPPNVDVPPPTAATPGPLPTLPPEGNCYVPLNSYEYTPTTVGVEYDQFHLSGYPAGGEVVHGSGKSNSCMQKYLAECSSDNTMHSIAENQGVEFYGNPALQAAGLKKAAADDCVVAKIFIQNAWGLKFQDGQWKNSAGKTYGFNRGYAEYSAHPVAGAFYLDDNCNVTDTPPLDKVCASGGFDVSYIISPISLIWDEKFDIDNNVTFTKFQLASQAEVYSWKASGAAPLVVFDPEHTGKILSGEQLFGNSTFGKTWKNGYDALSSLDTNHDNKLSEGELNSLGLWFDKNRDGISDSGEVISIRETGITALYTTFDTNKQNGDLVAVHGFDLTIKGKAVSGRSIDWFSRGFNSLSEGTAYYQRQSRSTDIKEQTLKNNNEDDKINAALSGLWSWRLKYDKKKSFSPGLLMFVAKGTKLSGASVAEMQFATNRFGVKGKLIVSSIEGQFVQTSSGDYHLTFDVKDPSGGITKNEAVLNTARKELTGESQTELIGAPDGVHSLTYKWSGTRTYDSKEG